MDDAKRGHLNGAGRWVNAWTPSTQGGGEEASAGKPSEPRATTMRALEFGGRRWEESEGDGRRPEKLRLLLRLLLLNHRLALPESQDEADADNAGEPQVHGKVNQYGARALRELAEFLDREHPKLGARLERTPFVRFQLELADRTCSETRAMNPLSALEQCMVQYVVKFVAGLARLDRKQEAVDKGALNCAGLWQAFETLRNAQRVMEQEEAAGGGRSQAGRGLARTLFPGVVELDVVTTYPSECPSLVNEQPTIVLTDRKATRSIVEQTSLQTRDLNKMTNRLMLTSAYLSQFPLQHRTASLSSQMTTTSWMMWRQETQNSQSTSTPIHATSSLKATPQTPPDGKVRSSRRACPELQAALPTLEELASEFDAGEKAQKSSKHCSPRHSKSAVGGRIDDGVEGKEAKEEK
ncbi:hypothetical protein VTK73DRAFT_10128 [Phialemonium thermophilum]|uniref:Uncharacterized protein n=1 Tax=Phialemonium thermophilum TaxID=223376 RepID=A0ABR3VYQ6_9PEZI